MSAFRHGLHWTMTHERMLLEWHEAGGRDFDDIAEQLGRTPRACVDHLAILLAGRTKSQAVEQSKEQRARAFDLAVAVDHPRTIEGAALW